MRSDPTRGGAGRRCHRALLGWTALFALAWPALAGDGKVALRGADPACPDDSGNIYVDCGNGTVTDNRSGLVWLKEASCVDGQLAFSTALWVTNLHDVAETFGALDCGLDDNSSPGDWRLPTADEWEAMTADAVALGCGGAFGPMITSDNGTSCWQEGPGSSFTDIRSDFYWAATNNGGMAWIHSLDDATTALRLKTGMDWVWPVRSGK